MEIRLTGKSNIYEQITEEYARFIRLGALMGAMGRLMYVEGAFVLLLLALTLIGELVLYFVYRRSFRLKRVDVISIAVSLVIAVALFFALPMR